MDTRVKHVIELFTRQLGAKHSEKMLARSVNLSPARLRQLFKEETGLAPIQYLKHLRMKSAAELLNSTFLSIKEIAFQTGSGDASHFVRDFRKLKGVTPSQFRIQNKRPPRVQTKPPNKRIS